MMRLKTKTALRRNGQRLKREARLAGLREARSMLRSAAGAARHYWQRLARTFRPAMIEVSA